MILTPAGVENFTNKSSRRKEFLIARTMIETSKTCKLVNLSTKPTSLFFVSHSLFTIVFLSYKVSRAKIKKRDDGGSVQGVKKYRNWGYR
jgi:hypothetical protein